MLEILKQQLNAEFNKPKAKNAKEGQEPRNEERIKSLQAEINTIKAEMDTEPNTFDDSEVRKMEVQNLTEVTEGSDELTAPVNEEIGNSIL